MEFGDFKTKKLTVQWKREDKDFTPWLRDHLDYLNDCLGLHLTPQGIEQKTGAFFVDILATDHLNNTIIIENQYRKTDHKHLGQILTYLAYHGANKAIWICEEPRPEHEKVVDWLNENTDEDFYIVKLELFSIDDSRPYPKFTKIRGPSSVTKSIRIQKEELNEVKKKIYEFWEQFMEVLNIKFQDHSGIPSTNDFILRTAKKPAMGYMYKIGRKDTAIALYSDKKQDKEFNIKRIRQIESKKDEIESEFGDKLVFDIDSNRNYQKITYNILDGGLDDVEKWSEIQNNLADSMKKFVNIIQKYVDGLE